jgi:predicted nucleic acid binding AN1-type Zn finger protein
MLGDDQPQGEWEELVCFENGCAAQSDEQCPDCEEFFCLAHLQGEMHDCLHQRMIISLCESYARELIH